MIDRIDNINDVIEEIEVAIEKERKALPPESLPIFEKALDKMLSENLSVKEALEMPEETLKEFYEKGYYFFKSGKFQEALTIFKLLRLLDDKEPHYVHALAVTHHQMKHYEDAVYDYLLYTTYDPTNPIPYYHLSDCFTKLGKPLLTLRALTTASELAGIQPEFKEWKDKLDMEIANFQA